MGFRTGNHRVSVVLESVIQVSEQTNDPSLLTDVFQSAAGESVAFALLTQTLEHPSSTQVHCRAGEIRVLLGEDM